MLHFEIRYTSLYGEMGVNINGVGYTYFIDAGFIPMIEETSKLQPGKALNDLKRLAYHYTKEGGD